MRPERFFIFLLAIMLVACQTAAGPERRDLLGSWVSTDIADIVIRMTVAETARSVEGAGSWTEATSGHAFRVTGVLATDEVALHFDFTDRPDLSFQGAFTDEDILEGTLSGGVYRLRTISFEREDLLP
jgi:hypothetical protein